MSRDGVQNIRNQFMRKNFLEEIATVDQQVALQLANAPFNQLQNWVNQYNQNLSMGVTSPQSNPLYG